MCKPIYMCDAPCPPRPARKTHMQVPCRFNKAPVI